MISSNNPKYIEKNKCKLLKSVIYLIFFLFLSSSVSAITVVSSFYADEKAINDAYEQDMDAVVWIMTEGRKKGIDAGTGVLIQVPGLEEYEGRLILTAAHVIASGIKHVVPKVRGLPTGMILQDVGVRVPKEFDYDRIDETRDYDYGIIILDKPFSGVDIKAKELPTTRTLTADQEITLVGYGVVWMFYLKPPKILLPDFNRRLFRNRNSTVPTGSSRLFDSDIGNIKFASHIHNLAFPYFGDSGGPVFLSSNLSQVIGIMSGMPRELTRVYYVNVTRNDIRALLEKPIVSTESSAPTTLSSSSSSSSSSSLRAQAEEKKTAHAAIETSLGTSSSSSSSSSSSTSSAGASSSSTTGASTESSSTDDVTVD